MKLKQYLSIGLLAVIPALAENSVAPVSGPVLGYVNKSSRVRPLIGIPGASYFGPAFDLENLELAAVSSQSGYVLALTTARTGARILIPGSEQPLQNLADFDSRIDAIALSPRGSTAAVARGSQIEIWTGLPQKPARLRTIDIPSQPFVFAVSDDGESLAAVEAGVLSLFDSSGQKQIATLTAVSELRFRSNSRELIYSDGSSVMTAAADGVRIVAGSADGISSPRAALFSADGSLVLIADAGANELVLIRPQSGVSERVKLPCTPSGLALMNDSTLRLQCENDAQTRLVELTPMGMRVLFVPEPVE